MAASAFQKKIHRMMDSKWDAVCASLDPEDVFSVIVKGPVLEIDAQTKYIDANIRISSLESRDCKCTYDSVLAILQVKDDANNPMSIPDPLPVYHRMINVVGAGDIVTGSFIYHDVIYHDVAKYDPHTGDSVLEKVQIFLDATLDTVKELNQLTSVMSRMLTNA